MSHKSLSSRSLLELIEIFERSAQGITDGDGQRLYGVPGWSLTGQFNLTAWEIKDWTERIGYAGCYPASSGDEPLLVDIEEDDEPGRYRYRCPETFRAKYVSAERVSVYSVTITKLLNYVADLLGVPLAQRRGITEPAIDGSLWRLGKMRVENIHLDVWVVRGLHASIAAVFRHLDHSALPDTGVILTTGSDLPEIVLPPRGYRLIPIRQVLVAHSSSPKIDTELIHRYLIASPGSKPQATPPVKFDQFTKTLHITTRDVEPWVISGKKQSVVIKLLVDQFEKGRRRVSAGEILVAAHGSKEAAKGKRVASIFSGSTKWLDYIEHDDDGYGIKVE